jgi:hypothetical protein
MASWEEVQGFIEKELSAKNKGDDFWLATLALPDNRTQIVGFCKKIDKLSKAVWLDIQSPVGKIDSREKLDKALDFLAGLTCGGLIKLDDVYFVRHGIPIDDLSANEINGPLLSVCFSADILEEKLVGGDNW